MAEDSYFSSMQSAKALEEMGLRFVGVVKHASRQYPMHICKGSILLIEAIVMVWILKRWMEERLR